MKGLQKDLARQTEDLSDGVSHLLEECRMVLPGIQALFGFQLIAVFNATFWSALRESEQLVHFAAITLVALSVAFVMAPAAYHRQTTPSVIPRHFLRISTRLLTWSMYPLMGGILLDFYLIGKLLLHSERLSLVVTCFLFFIFSILWVLLPRMPILQRWIEHL